MPKSGVPSSFSNDSTNIFLAVEFALDGGYVRLWTGYGNIAINSDTYYGLGKCLSVSSISETGQMSMTGVTIGVSGITSSATGDSDLITDALNEPLQYRTVTCRIGSLNNQRVSSSYIIFKGVINTMSIDDSAETSTVFVQCESRFAEFMRSSTLRYTDAEQSQVFSHESDDTFQHVASLQNKKIDWS